MYSLEELKQNLTMLGVQNGDTLLIRADLGAIGRLETKKRDDYINIFLEAVGPEGTIVGLSFTDSSFLKKNKNIIFDGTNKSYTGAFANAMLFYPGAIRSTHPTNSYVAIGKYAKYITRDHDENSGAYDPIRKIIELNGKMILAGCVQSSPGFTTTHLAEVDIGLYKRIIAPWLTTAYFKSHNGAIKLFRRKDLGSCSSTFYRLYSYYVLHERLKQGYIGNAYSVLIDARSAYEIDRAVLMENPKIVVCKNPDCMLCRARRWDNLIDLPGYFLRFVFKKVFG